MTFEDAVRVLLDLIRQHRVAGDEDLEAALTRVEACLPAKQ